MESRQQFEVKYPLPEGMYFNVATRQYMGVKEFWLWNDRWEVWLNAQEAMVVKLPSTGSDETLRTVRAVRDYIEWQGIRTK